MVRAKRWPRDFFATWRELRAEKTRARRLRELYSMIRPYRGRVLLMFIALGVAIVTGLAPPILAKYAIDEGISQKDSTVLAIVAGVYVLSALALWASTYVQTYLVGWVGQRALKDLRIRLFDHLQKMSVGFYARRKTGVLISRLTNDVQALDQLVSDGIVTLAQATVTLIVIVVIMMAQDVMYALVCLSLVPLVLLASFVFRVLSTGVYRNTRERIAAVTSHLQETISGVLVVRSYGREQRHIGELVELSEANRDANMRSVRLNAAYFPTVELLSAVATAIVLLYGGYLTIDGQLEIGVVVMFAGLVQSLFDPIQQLSQLYTTYQSGMAALDKIFDLLDEAPDMIDQPGAPELGKIRGEIELRDVSFSYLDDGDDAGGRWALRDVNLKIAPGETIALVGATGAGKSTLAKLVTRFHDPQRGTVLVDDQDLKTVQSASLRRQIGYVPQEGYLFTGSVADNIAFGRPDATRAQIEESARSVGAYEAIAALSDGFDTPVGERGSHLSAGQRQLVAFARALITDPRLLILDEATASVDVQTETRIEDGLRRLLAGRTALVIAHRLSTIQRASRIAVMEQGEIVELGPHSELIAAGGRYAALYATWEESTGVAL